MGSKRCGIYRIRNRINNHCYIGSSNDIKRRFNTHRYTLNNNKHHNIPLQRSWNKYEPDEFIFEVIEECKKEDKLERERYYFEVLKPEYNTARDPLAPMQGRKHKPETLEKLKGRKILQGKEHYAWGKTFSEEHRRNMSDSHKGSKRNNETKSKMSNTAKRINAWERMKGHIERNKRKVKDNFGNIFNSLMDAAKYYSMSIQAVCDILKGRTKASRLGVTFIYV